MLDQKGERNEGDEPGEYQRVSGEVLVGDIQFCSEITKKEDKGQGQKGNERFHFCEFAC